MLGANDGIVSTASLVLGVAASGASGAAIVTAGIAGLVAGALSMAAGEYVSVSSQRDAERADLRLEERELRRDPAGELRELAGIYEQRGLPPALASEVAAALSRRGALEAHARDELGLDEERLARPFQAAWTSALSFSAGAALPLLAVAATPAAARVGVDRGRDADRARAARRPRRAAGRCAAAPRDGPGRRLGRRRDGDHRGHRRARRHRHLTRSASRASQDFLAADVSFAVGPPQRFGDRRGSRLQPLADAGVETSGSTRERPCQEPHLSPQSHPLTRSHGLLLRDVFPESRLLGRCHDCRQVVFDAQSHDWAHPESNVLCWPLARDAALFCGGCSNARDASASTDADVPAGA